MPNVHGRYIKKSVEAFRAGKASAYDVYTAFGRVLEHNASLQRGLDLRPVFDDDLVDRMLRHAVMFGIVPKRFGEPKEVAMSLDRYLSMAWGNEGVPAVEMIKWFGTNYHYAKPELERKPRLTRDFVSPLIEQGTKPALIGPWTLLTLGSKYEHHTNEYLFSLLASEYQKLIERFPKGTIVQIEEPSFLTHGMPDFYAAFLNGLGRPVHLHTYYGPATEFAQKLFGLKVSGIGLDFVAGPENLELLQDFPRNVDLIAGVLDGKSGRPADKSTVRTLDEILRHVPESRLWISPSSPLLHVRQTADGIGLPDGVTRSYAAERLRELEELRDKSYRALPVITSRSYELPEERFTRQRLDNFKLVQPFLTSHVGSFPQIADLRRIRREYQLGRITEEAYKEFVGSMIQEIVRVQQRIGIEIPVTGEYDRDDMVAFFARQWNGYLTPRGDVQSYRTLVVSPPLIVGDIKATKPIALEWILKAKEIEPNIKATLTGPVTMVWWSERRDDVPVYLQLYQAAEAIRTEIRALIAAGVHHIQVDEPALGEAMPLPKFRKEEYINHATNAFRLATMGIPKGVTLWSHLCFTEFDEYLLKALKGLEVDIVAIESSRSNGGNAQFLYGNGYEGAIAVGTFDVHSGRIRPAIEIVENIDALLSLGMMPEKIALVPDCGQKATPQRTAEEQLKQMVQAAEVLRGRI